MNLDDIRSQIDGIDHDLLELLSRRADLVHEVGVVKKRDGLQIYAPEREEALLRRLIELNQGRLQEKSIRAIYRGNHVRSTRSGGRPHHCLSGPGRDMDTSSGDQEIRPLGELLRAAEFL